jgi:hypothetical protein
MDECTLFNDVMGEKHVNDNSSNQQTLVAMLVRLTLHYDLSNITSMATKVHRI